MRKVKAIIVSALLIGSLAACGTNNTSPEEDIEVTAPNEELLEVPGGDITDEPVEAPIEENDEPGIDDEEMILIPEMKELNVIVEGEIEKRVAHLAVSDLNYSLFVLEGYSLQSEEPGRDVLLFDFDDEFFVRLEPLGKDQNAAELENNIVQFATGAIKGGYSVPLANVEYSVKEIIEEGSEQMAIIHFAKDHNGNLFKFTMFIPAKEAAEGVEPSFWAMLDTLSAGE